jgi:protein TIF31
LGLDSPSTVQEYVTLAHYCFATAQVPASLKLLYRARYLLKLIHGENHPEMATIDQNIGLVLYFSAQFDYAQSFFQNALKLHMQYQVKKVKFRSKNRWGYLCKKRVEPFLSIISLIVY